jgi:hypothetical protein
MSISINWSQIRDEGLNTFSNYKPIYTEVSGAAITACSVNLVAYGILWMVTSCNSLEATISIELISAGLNGTLIGLTKLAVPVIVASAAYSILAFV